MKYSVRKEMYSASNVTFDPKAIKAFSYGWWQFVGVINGKVVFNAYNYSNTTCKHQSKVRSLLRDLGITIDVEIHAPMGLQSGYRHGVDYVGLESAINHYEAKIKSLQEAIAKPGSRKLKNEERTYDIVQLRKQIKTVQSLLKAQNSAKIGA